MSVDAGGSTMTHRCQCPRCAIGVLVEPRWMIEIRCPRCGYALRLSYLKLEPIGEQS